ncbi:uncharacterized protein BO88DRAFT_426692 [Aspergillus vadensis CBS 113365]|uniref:Uncharacterized protein n=1 Tax=Aspergillus vadensis (strain CBS 113365 / IMI 142717 / IBT 24658) TaxID=1448311 RepID=A0A319B5H0_ASPVC|nr:hypothetical protein BO88DRAFT_426692 [Aspergillus vadensis CBS 113365]PYH68046.1 hypothetical protein BO88DRAFT_426692 [Aspergillus vadensis CBS 113365]
MTCLYYQFLAEGTNEMSKYVDVYKVTHGKWGAWAARKFNERKRLVVPAAELEQLDLETETPIWSYLYLLDNPFTSCLQGSHLFFGASLARQRKFVGFHMANIFEEDWNWRITVLNRYAMRQHCWLLVDRFLGHEVVKQDLRGISDCTHMSLSPFMMPDIRRLISEATQVHKKNRRHDVPLKSIVSHIPLEIKIIIKCSFHTDRSSATQHLYVQEIIEAKTPIDWAYFCHGLHELLLQEDWYCDSGLYVRGRILHLNECIKESLWESV